MTDRRTHRGPHPGDLEDFAPVHGARLGEAVGDLSWLLGRGYSPKAAVKLVGDRLSLTSRQRLAVQRCACADAARSGRRSREVGSKEMAGRVLWLDGFNVLTCVEAALGGGFILIGRDGCCRDMASIHGHYKRVEETIPAIEATGLTLQRLGIGEAVWFLDRPVSNSGRLARWIRETGLARDWRWRVEVVANPDPVLARSAEVVATADSVVLDACRHWFNLAREVLAEHVPGARLVDLSREPVPA